MQHESGYRLSATGESSYSTEIAPCLHPPRINGNFSDNYEMRET
jgi:hypothetical protein